jgi:Tfp pilus assembly protein PilV
MRSSSSARSGFVLMEAVVALAIIGLVAIALLATTASQVRTADKASLLLTARSLADERMATMRMLSYDQLREVPDSLLTGTFPSPFDAWSWRAEVVQIDENDEYDLFSVGVAVDGYDESFSLRTLVHEPRPTLTTSTATQGGGRR